MPVETTSPPAPVERVEAQVGVGAKGRDYGSGPIATPAAAYWGVKQRIVFEIQIPQAMNLYKATNGNPPATQDEFFAQIIKANKIELPELPAGEKYVYDVEAAKLMVERPSE